MNVTASPQHERSDPDMHHSTRRFLRSIALALIAIAVLAPAAYGSPQGRNSANLRARALAGPMADVPALVFCTRSRYDDGHWYANIGYYCDDENRKAYAGNGRPDVGKLLKLDVRSGDVTTILDAKGGSIRDPQVHYDARKVLFSYRKAGTHHYNLWEIDVDGANLRQLTSGDVDDYEATYLPDGDILFVSTRCNRWVNCWKTQVGTMYRCEGDGSDIRPVSANTEHDNTPWVLPDGRVLYTRWEYVDRSQVEFHHLWVMNPDGTGQSVFYGNQHPHIVMIDAKPIPGSRKILANFSPGHGRNEHKGVATIVSPDSGPDDRGAARSLHRGRQICDPWAFSEDCFIAARDREIVLMDGSGRVEVLYTHRGPGNVHEPRPIAPRPRERIIPEMPEGKAAATGTMVLTDVYNGRRLDGVKHGDIRKLLVLESLPKPVNFSGGPDLTSWLGTFTLERVLGTVPVEKDGSACFEVPANRQVFFVALDENDLSVKRMQSFTCVMPGEVLSCVGCHEERTLTPASYTPQPVLQALRRPPSAIERFEGFPDVVDFHRDVQPILDRYCVECHGYEKREGNVILAGDLGLQWSHAYFSLFAHRQVADGRNGLGNQPPRTIGSSASALLDKVDGSHYDVRAKPEDWRMLWLWIESGATYAGSYAALRNGAGQARSGQAVSAFYRNGGGRVLQTRCVSCHKPGSDRSLPTNQGARTKKLRQTIGRPTAIHERLVEENDPVARFGMAILFNMTRPHFSPLILGPLAKDAGGFGSCPDVFKSKDETDYKKLLGALDAAKKVIDAEPRYSTPGFRPNRQYVRELKKYGVLPADFDPSRDEIDVFRSDQAYWESLWCRTSR